MTRTGWNEETDWNKMSPEIVKWGTWKYTFISLCSHRYSVDGSKGFITCRTETGLPITERKMAQQ